MLFFLENLVDLPKVNIRNVIQEGKQAFLILSCQEEEVKCNYCGSLTDELHQTNSVLVRDLSISGQMVYLKVPRRKFYCKDCQRFFTENLEFMEARRKYTVRYEEYIYGRVNVSSVEQVGREESLSWDQVNGIYQRQCEAKKKDWQGVKHLGMDEIAKRKGHQNFVTVLGDIEKGELIEVIDSHQQDKIIEVLMEKELEVREGVEQVSVDMWGGFPKVIEKVFPNAVIVTDRFHVMKALNEELNKIRKQTKLNVKIKGEKWLLLKNKEDLKEEELEKLELVLKQSARLRKAYEYKESFREIYEKVNDKEEGRLKFTEWLENAKSIYTDVISTIRRNLDSICNYFLSRTTNGAMEGINNRLKLIKRQAYGFMNFDNMRNRFLACFS
ncbi:MAG: ISL3 family transposase [Woronichinia naegeliana WA131]|uniref:ISL3 family transposase n=1 Tax=Woronichinia naegeliana WA131 TaxID=2824559 RepID=A0A977KRT6_9CYAN|nr:MAG: ISL3 family transposase [Woronichinia naegeliana WA131]UXE59509.1 MAG: ISL3 family transposase [Woronichinia naegeliana WA131]UXE61330.1 MAG: ISL3 family transposase [Woronichinia naegeliana WA131]UXE63584.1 MAG: ISL3 family transposase [Woronichinia naegeliana WA131]UXE63809.1 MAG: ISL3 family transposase [Woronichinia naegeliana WA131]